MQANLKDFEGLSYKKVGNTEVHSEHSEPIVAHHGSNMVLSSVSERKLKTLKTNKEWYLTIERFQMSKLTEQELVWVDQVAKVV